MPYNNLFDIPLKTHRKKKRRQNPNRPTNIPFWRKAFTTGSSSIYTKGYTSKTQKTPYIIPKEPDVIDLVDDNSPNNPMTRNLSSSQKPGSDLAHNKPGSSQLSVFGSKFAQQQAIKQEVKIEYQNKNNQESSTEVIYQSDTQNVDKSSEVASQNTGMPDDSNPGKPNDIAVLKQKNKNIKQNASNKNAQPRPKQVLKGLASDITLVRDKRNFEIMQMKSKASAIDVISNVDFSDDTFVINSQIAQQHTQIETEFKIIQKGEGPRSVKMTKVTEVPGKQINTILSLERKPKQLKQLVTKTKQTAVTQPKMQPAPPKMFARNFTTYIANEILAMNYHKGIPKSFITHNALIAPDFAATLNPMATFTPQMPNPGDVPMNALGLIPNLEVPVLMSDVPGLASMVQPTPGMANFPVVNAPQFVPNMPLYSTPGFGTPNQHANMPMPETSEPLWQTEAPVFDSHIEETPTERYSPSDMYSEGQLNTSNTSQEQREKSESPDFIQSGQKRLSAFQRLGPVTQPKKPKLTINLSINKEQSVREVVDLTDPEVQQKDMPVHLRPYILSSEDVMVMKYRLHWPWRKHVVAKKSVTYRPVRTVMIMEQEQMEELYKSGKKYFQITVIGYPSSWTKEDVLDTVLNALKDEVFIPCFIEHTSEECKFLVTKCHTALLQIHKMLFQIKLDGIVLTLTITETNLNSKQMRFETDFILKRRLLEGYDDERKLILSAFTLEPDVSHFIYFPLNRLVNHSMLNHLANEIVWEYLTDLDLSRNRLTFLKGFNLNKSTPKLKHLDLSHNLFEKVTVLLCCRELALHTLNLEGNPLCTNYTDPAEYVAIIRMIFPVLRKIDDVRIPIRGSLPPSKKNYCPQDAVALVEKFIDIYFSLLDLAPADRIAMKELYNHDAVLTITHDVELRFDRIFRYFHSLYQSSHSEEQKWVSVDGAAAITSHLCIWPAFKHDPHTFIVDVLYHGEYSTIIRIGGILKLTSDKLADDEHLLAFTRTVVLRAHTDIEYKISNEMVHWDKPIQKYPETAFQINTVKPKKLDFALITPIDDELKDKVIELFMNLTELDRDGSERCLKLQDWNFKNALEHFMNLWKTDDLQSLKKRSMTPKSAVDTEKDGKNITQGKRKRNRKNVTL